MVKLVTGERLGMKMNYGSTGSCGVSGLAVGSDKYVNVLVLCSLTVEPCLTGIYARRSQ